MSVPPRPPEPVHRRLAARAPRWLHRRMLRFEARTVEELRQFAASLPAGARVLDAGAGECQHREYFGSARYTAVDLAIGDRTWDYSKIDAVADLEQLPFPDACFQAALNVVVLEHTQRPGQVLKEIGRVLEPGGRLLLIVPQEWGVHQSPHDYFRFTRHGLDLLLREAGFASFTIAPVGGFFTLVGRRLLDTVVFFMRGWRWLLFPFAAVLCGPAGLLAPFLDGLDGDKHTTLGYACIAVR
jgi:SAM-dependent methyltransferase